MVASGSQGNSRCSEKLGPGLFLVCLSPSQRYDYDAARTRNFARQTKMILTTCAACAAPLAHDAPRCVRCWTRYCNATCQKGGAGTLDDVREAVETLENTERTARRVLGGAHPIAEVIEQSLRRARAALAAREEETAAA